MKNEKIYGFSVMDKNGLGFTRWFNGSEVFITNNPKRKLPFGLNKIYVTQHYLDFSPAIKFIVEKSIIEENKSLKFVFLTEQDWKAIQHPVKRFFNKLFNRM